MKVTEAEVSELTVALATAVNLGYILFRRQETYRKLLAERDEQKLSLETLRDEFLNDPDHDNDTINWALGVVDAHSPDSDHRVMRYEE